MFDDRFPAHARIDTDDEADLKRWSDFFGVTPYRLRNAVMESGPVARDVRRDLVRGRLNSGSA